MGSVMEQISAAAEAMAGTWWVYLVTWALATIDGFFPPVPSESVVVSLAAISASTGAPHLALLFVAAACGAVLGDNIAYQIGRSVHPTENSGPRWMRGRRMQRTFAWARRALDRRGAVMILVARHIPVGRVAVNMMAGATGYPRRRFFVLTVVAAVLWAGYGIGIGVLACNWIKDQPLVAAALAVVVAAILGFIVDRIFGWFNRRHGIALEPEPAAPSQPSESTTPESTTPHATTPESTTPDASTPESTTSGSSKP